MTFAWRFPGRGIKRAQPDRLRPFYVICARAILRQVRILTKNYADMKKQQSDKLNAVKGGRGDRIRTCGLFVPNEALYQAEPHLDFLLSAVVFS